MTHIACPLMNVQSVSGHCKIIGSYSGHILSSNCCKKLRQCKRILSATLFERRRNILFVEKINGNYISLNGHGRNRICFEQTY